MFSLKNFPIRLRHDEKDKTINEILFQSYVLYLSILYIYLKKKKNSNYHQLIFIFIFKNIINFFFNLASTNIFFLLIFLFLQWCLKAIKSFISFEFFYMTLCTKITFAKKQHEKINYFHHFEIPFYWSGNGDLWEMSDEQNVRLKNCSNISILIHVFFIRKWGKHTS